jgi:hypothetical protein
MTTYTDSCHLIWINREEVETTEREEIIDLLPSNDETNDEVNTQSLTQTRWNSALVTHIYKEKLDSIDLKSICSTFVPRNGQRKLFFGVF